MGTETLEAPIIRAYSYNTSTENRRARRAIRKEERYYLTKYTELTTGFLKMIFDEKSRLSYDILYQNFLDLHEELVAHCIVVKKFRWLKFNPDFVPTIFKPQEKQSK
jgi:hypothetical protein